MAVSSLDRTDRAIVAALQNDGRLPNSALAALVGVAPSTCLERVRALRARGVVRGFHAEISLEALSRGLEAIVAVRVRAHARTLVEEFRAHALTLPEVVQVFHVTGADDFLLHVAVRDTNALRDFVLDRLASRPEVAHVETRVVYEHARRPVLEPLE
jgi:DNA-binding Lrp family transcriptional regulator